MSRRLWMIRYALKACARRLGVNDFDRTSDGQLNFVEGLAYEPPARRWDGLVVLVWPHSLEVREYSSDHREPPCRSNEYETLRAFLKARVAAQIDRGRAIAAHSFIMEHENPTSLDAVDAGMKK